MNTCRKYGNAPFSIALIHGGPGAAGSMMTVAEKLSKHFGVLEPLQTKRSIPELIEELYITLLSHHSFPITLIGHSWGAWLSYIFAAKYPDLVKKLILVSSGPFETKYAEEISNTRWQRFSLKERQRFKGYLDTLLQSDTKTKNETFAKLGHLIQKADAFHLNNANERKQSIQYELYEAIWPEAEALRRSGKLLALGNKIKCPVIAIHGDHDPHPTAGVEGPLSQLLKNFRFILMQQCGHEPWREKHAVDEFYQILIEEVQI